MKNRAKLRVSGARSEEPYAITVTVVDAKPGNRLLVYVAEGEQGGQRLVVSAEDVEATA